MIGLDSVSLTGKGTLVDSFDSSIGPYGSANQGSEASLFSNGLVAVGSARVAATCAPLWAASRSTRTVR